ncbi:MAG: DUF3796 domain-containing protein [Candidatus Woesearchaeota archaeon]
MKKNKLSLLGLLGLVGLLGIPTQNYGLFGFFGFFGFLALAGIKNDEMLKENISKAGRNAFVVSTIAVAITMILLTTFENLGITAIMIAVTFVAQILTFSFSLSFYERK